jgi:hypothetical protein
MVNSFVWLLFAQCGWFFGIPSWPNSSIIVHGSVSIQPRPCIRWLILTGYHGLTITKFISDFENRLIVFGFYNRICSFFIWISITSWWMTTAKFYVQILESPNLNQFFLKKSRTFFLENREKKIPEKLGNFFSRKNIRNFFSGKYLKNFRIKYWNFFPKKRSETFFSRKYPKISFQ